MENSGVNLVFPALDSCLRRNDDFAMVMLRHKPKAHLQSAGGWYGGGGWKVDQSGLGLAPQWSATIPMFIRR